MSRIFAWVHEPWAINAAQFIQFLIAAFAGFMAALGSATPQFISTAIPAPLIIAVGVLFVIGGAIGTYAVARGNWGVERIALWVIGIAFASLTPAAIYAIYSGKSPAVWLVLVLIGYALLDVFKRYRRIDWAYLDPAR